MLLRNFGIALVALTPFALAACVNDDKLPVIPPLPEASVPTIPAPTTTASPDAEPPPDSAVPPVDAGPEGSAFASGLGAGAVVTKSSKYTLITKTGGSPGGHGVGKAPAHTIVSGAASGSKK